MVGGVVVAPPASVLREVGPVMRLDVASNRVVPRDEEGGRGRAQVHEHPKRRARTPRTARFAVAGRSLPRSASPRLDPNTERSPALYPGDLQEVNSALSNLAHRRSTALELGAYERPSDARRPLGIDGASRHSRTHPSPSGRRASARTATSVLAGADSHPSQSSTPPRWPAITSSSRLASTPSCSPKHW